MFQNISMEPFVLERQTSLKSIAFDGPISSIPLNAFGGTRFIVKYDANTDVYIASSKTLQNM